MENTKTIRKLNEVQISIIAQSTLKEVVNVQIENAKISNETGFLRLDLIKNQHKDIFKHTIELIEKEMNK